MWAASGPLVEPPTRSGVRAGPYRRCACRPTFGEACARCDGTSADEWAVTRATPAERRAFVVDMAAWQSRRAGWAAAALTTDEHGGDAA